MHPLILLCFATPLPQRAKATSKASSFSKRQRTSSSLLFNYFEALNKGYYWRPLNDVLTQNFSHFGQVISDSSCGLIVDNTNSLNGVCIICSKFWCQNVKVGALTPFTFNDINIEVEALLLINPKQTELTNQERYNTITRRQCVCECTLPCTSTWTKSISTTT